MQNSNLLSSSLRAVLILIQCKTHRDNNEAAGALFQASSFPMDYDRGMEIKMPRENNAISPHHAKGRHILYDDDYDRSNNNNKYSRSIHFATAAVT
jgi:hypothetical protein